LDSHPSFEALFQNASCGLLVTTEDGHIRIVNATFCIWSGYSAAELVAQRRIQDLFTMGGRIFHQTHWAPLLRMQGSVSEVQLDIYHRNGQVIPIMLNGVRRQHGDTVFHELSVFFARDRKLYERELLNARKTAEALLEEKKQTAQELQRLNKELADTVSQKDVFLAMLAHELRNPINPIGMAAAMIKMKSREPEVARYCMTIERQIKQLSRLVEDLLDVSRISTGTIALKMERVSLGEVLQVAMDAAQPLFNERGQSFVTGEYDSEATLHCDAARVSQIIGNLLVNASKYTEDGGVIQLSATCNNNELSVIVADNGIGIPADKLEAIFGLFNQVERETERARHGMGIGLALVRDLCRLHGGSVQARSEGAHKGSHFEITLPIVVTDPETEIYPQ
jgi:PAS domain S-box-containing protein